MSEEAGEYVVHTSLVEQVRRAADAKRRGGPGLHAGLVIASLVPSAWELADKIIERDPDTTEAEALEMGHVARTTILEVLEEALTTTTEPKEDA